MSREGGTTYNKAPSATGIDIERKVYIGPSPTLQSGSATAVLRLCYPPPFLARAPHLAGRTERRERVGRCRRETGSACWLVHVPQVQRCVSFPRIAGYAVLLLRRRERGSPSLPLFFPKGGSGRELIWPRKLESVLFFLSLLPVPSQPSFTSLPTSQVKRSPIPAGGPIVCSDPS